jgi:Spy/CpxP family protein refolding chaperone
MNDGISGNAISRRARMGMGLALALALSAGAQPGPGPGAPGMGHDGPDGHGGAGMEMFLSPRMLHDLNLSADQEKKLKDIHLAAEKKKIQLHSEKATLELDLKTALSAYPVNKSEALRLADKIADVDKRMTLHRVETLTQVLGNLTADQHAKLMTMQDEWMEKRRAWREEWRKDRFEGRRDGKDGKDAKGPKGQGD